MLMPSIFGEDMFDEFMRDFPFFDENAGNKIEKKQVILKRCQEQDDSADAKTVNRTDRAIQKAAVYEMMFFKGGKGNFGAPAKKSVNKKV